MIESIGRLAAFPRLIHGFTTRLGGVSEPPHATLNLGFARPDDPDAVLENRRRVAAALGFSLDNAVLAGQVHGTAVRAVTADDRGRGAYGPRDILPPADGLITDAPEIVLWANFADCTPLLFFDPITPAVGVAHAGWRGTVGNIAGAMVAALGQHYGSHPADLIAVIGPAIGPCCYEVDEPVISEAQAAFGEKAAAVLPRPPGNERPHFDQWGANRHWLAAAGLNPHNIVTSGICTACHVDRFFSHRKERGATGRFAAVIGLLNQERVC